MSENKVFQNIQGMKRLRNGRYYRTRNFMVYTAYLAHCSHEDHWWASWKSISVPWQPPVCHRTTSFIWRLSISNATKGTGRMHEVCESHRSVMQFIQQGFWVFLARVGLGSLVGQGVKFMSAKNHLGASVLMLLDSLIK